LKRYIFLEHMTDALIESQQSDRALTRFRIPWQWQGGSTVLQSRATDDKGNVQPTRDALIATNGLINRYHYHGIQSWSVVDSGEVRNVYV